MTYEPIKSKYTVNELLTHKLSNKITILLLGYFLFN